MIAQDGIIDQWMRRRVCARCYGDLYKRPVENRMWEAYCPTCAEAWGGTTISRWTAEQRGQRALAELYEVKANLADLFPNPHRGKTVKDLFGY